MLQYSHKIFFLVLTLLYLTISVGCDNLSPRDNFSPKFDQRLEDIEGNQNTLENNQNAIKLELGRLNNSLNVPGKDNRIQQGWFNVQADAFIIAIFSITVIVLLLYFMYCSIHYYKAANIMASEIKSLDDDVKENIMASAWNTDVEKTIFKMIQ